MERQPDYEDERVRQWRARPEERREWGTDPTVMDVDLTREEIYESRVYDVHVDHVVDLLIEEVAEEPELAEVLLAALQVNAERDVTMRLTAKRHLADGLISFAMVGVIGRMRDLIDREDLVPEPRYRTYVEEFETAMVDGGVVDAPTVIDVEGWRSYERLNRESP